MAVFEALELTDPRRVGRYRIVARLGAGGMGQVYLARSPGGRPVAVKTVRPDLAREGDFRRRFAREVAAARRVNGSFTAGVVDADPDGSPPWLATVYVPGVSLGEAIAGQGPWPARPVLALGAGLAEALEAIHAAGIVHRDLKPSNVLLAADGPRVIDFGISVANEASALTHTGMTIGTPGFMSPEQLTGHPVGPASDVFALGTVLAYTATGVGPFGTGTPHALHYRAVHEPPNLAPLPPELREIVAACLAKDPDRRPTIAHLLDRLTPADGPEDGGGETAATLLLSEPGWMPDQVARLVQAHATTSLPRTPPTPPGTTPTPLPSTPPPAIPDPATPAPTPSAAPPPPSAQPPRTAEQHHPIPPTPPRPTPASPLPAARQLDRVPLLHGPSPNRRGSISRRALLGLAGILTAGAGLTSWKILADNGPEPPWKFPTGDAVYSSPAVADDVVYVVGNDNKLYAVDTATGKERWIFAANGVVDLSPAVADGVVYVVGSTDGILYAVDASTGKKRWAFATSGTMYVSPTVADGVVYVVGISSDNAGGLHAVDATTGKERWTFAAVLYASPAAADGVVYISNGYDDLYAMDATTGEKRWTFAISGVVDSSPAVADGVVYFGSSGNDGGLYAVDATTGKKRWSFAANVYSSPAVADGVVYFSSSSVNEGKLYAVDTATGKKRWTFDLGAVTYDPSSMTSSPAVADGAVYVGSKDGNLYAVDAATGKKRWAFATSGRVYSSPAVADGAVYFGSTDGNLYAVRT
ncbi:outer membrane protein assembly factor BamB family protein [Streptomyces sp. NPDC002623]